MASCDDFSLLDDDHHHHQSNPNHPQIPNSHHLHQSYASHRFGARATTVHAPPPPTQPIISPSSAAAGSPQRISGGEEEEEDDGEDYNDAVLCSNAFDNGSDPARVRVVDARSDKRKDREELSDGATNNYGYSNNNNNNKKSKSSSGGAGTSGGGDYRKDREEWSDAAISCLLDAYTEKFTQLNRGNLRGRDWEEVAATVSERCEKQTKSVEQCKNKVDNLKKRYKLERQRMSNGGVSVSHWPWFKQMELIVGNSLPVKTATDDDKGGGSATSTPRQSKRYIICAVCKRCC
jgi:hypothetical protein